MKAVKVKRLAMTIALGAIVAVCVLIAWHLVGSRRLEMAARSPVSSDPTSLGPAPHASATIQESASPTTTQADAMAPDQGGEAPQADTLAETDDSVWQALANKLALEDPRILMVKAMLGAGEYDDALALLEEIIADERDTDVAALAHLMKGIALAAKGDMEGSLAEYQKIILEYPESTAALEAVQRFGQCHFALDTILDGMDWVINILESDPGNMAARKAKWELVARAARRGRVSDLEALWEICMVGLKGGDEPIEGYEAGLALAKSLARFNRTKMFELFNEIAQHCPYPDVQGEAKLELVERYAVWRPDDAIRLGEEVLASPADEYIKKQTRRNLVHAYLASGDVYLAQQTFDQVILDGWPESSLCYFLSASLGTAVSAAANHEALLSWLDQLAAKEGLVSQEALTWKAVLENPFDHDALDAASYNILRRLAEAYLSRNEFDLAGAAAAYCLHKVEAEHPGDLNKHLSAADLVARAMSAQGNYAGAEQVLRAAMDQYPDAIEAAEWVVPLAGYIKMTGRYDEAIAEYERVLEDFPDSIAAPRALYFMGQTYQYELQNPAKARESYQRLMIAYPDSHFVESAKRQLASLASSQ